MFKLFLLEPLASDCCLWAVGAAATPVLRGGSWNNNADNARCSRRNRNVPDNSNNNVGVRMVLSIARHTCASIGGGQGQRTRASRVGQRG